MTIIIILNTSRTYTDILDFLFQKTLFFNFFFLLEVNTQFSKGPQTIQNKATILLQNTQGPFTAKENLYTKRELKLPAGNGFWDLKALQG